MGCGLLFVTFMRTSSPAKKGLFAEMRSQSAVGVGVMVGDGSGVLVAVLVTVGVSVGVGLATVSVSDTGHLLSKINSTAYSPEKGI
jgi:hypothetical protein